MCISLCRLLMTIYIAKSSQVASKIPWRCTILQTTNMLKLCNVPLCCWSTKTLMLGKIMLKILGIVAGKSSHMLNNGYSCSKRQPWKWSCSLSWSSKSVFSLDRSPRFQLLCQAVTVRLRGVVSEQSSDVQWGSWLVRHWLESNVNMYEPKKATYTVVPWLTSVPTKTFFRDTSRLSVDFLHWVSN